MEVCGLIHAPDTLPKERIPVPIGGWVGPGIGMEVVEIDYR